jgi:hypothetical protein
MKLLQATAEPPPPESPPASEADVDTRLAALDRERAAALEILNGAEAGEKQLLEQDADELAFSRHDIRIKNARRTLARLDIRERKLIETGASIEAEARERLWQQHLARFKRAAPEFLQAAKEVLEKHAALWGIINDAHRAGFGAIGVPPFVAPPQMPWASSIPHWAAAVAGPAYDRPPNEWYRTEPTYGVHMLHTWIGNYRTTFSQWSAGMFCGFDADTAWHLVDAGWAEWSDPRNIPAKPAAWKPWPKRED